MPPGFGGWGAGAWGGMPFGDGAAPENLLGFDSLNCPGVGQNFGFNFGGGGIIRITNVLPLPGSTEGLRPVFQLSIGVAGSLIDIARTFVTINGTLAFNGSIADFTSSFPGPFSFYAYNPAINGYDFHIEPNFDLAVGTATVQIDSETVDGCVTSQSYTFNVLNFTYPALPVGAPLVNIPEERFTGEATTGLLAESLGLVFFSPALLQPNTGNQFDLDKIQVDVDASATYLIPDTIPNKHNLRFMKWGPHPDAGLLIALVNALRAAYEAHRTEPGVHLNDDTVNIVTAPVAVTVADAIVLINDIKTQYNFHLTEASGPGQVHSPMNDLNPVTSPNASDYNSCLILALELRAKYSVHQISLSYHLMPGTFPVPLPAITPPFGAFNDGLFVIDGEIFSVDTLLVQTIPPGPSTRIKII
jgi:hypothetical protein